VFLPISFLWDLFTWFLFVAEIANSYKGCYILEPHFKRDLQMFIEGLYEFFDFFKLQNLQNKIFMEYLCACVYTCFNQ
jgi:hypothetical protein